MFDPCSGFPPRMLPIAAVILFTLFIVTPLCGEFFRCGCDWPWNGLFLLCHSVRGVAPGCPWCEHPALGLAALALPIATGIAGARLGRSVFRLQPDRLGFVPPQGAWGEAGAALAAGLLGVLAGLYILGALNPYYFENPAALIICNKQETSQVKGVSFI
jgi:hypothetical protein